MQLRPLSWILSTLNILACQAAWVRKFPCGSSDKYDRPESPFRIDSLYGTLESFDSSTLLSLSILAIHDTARFECRNLNLPLLESSLRFHALGIAVGDVVNFTKNCPLPITDTLTPPEGSLFSTFELSYSFDHGHRLQTVVAEISFNTLDGVELDCVAPKITPDIGAAASGIFTYFPAAVMALVGIASWITHRKDELAWATLFEDRATWPILSPAWRVILELADYLRYLQFMFLAGSLTLEYPGFYQPIISQTDWSSLLYWAGPIDHGFTYTGVEDGIYVSNRSYGLEYMSQMIGFPQVPDIMINAFINLLILVFAVVVGSLILYLVMSELGRGFYLTPVTWDAGYILLGMVLSFFSLPLLSYLSYELILIGYLPNYRIIIVGFLMAIIVYSNFLITRHVDSQKDPSDRSSPALSQGSRSTRYLMKARQYWSQYFPAAIPLLQGIVIGGLQDWGLLQVHVLMGIEIILLLHMAISLRGRLFVSIPAWCSVARLLIVCLTFTFAYSRSELTKQWVGYVMLCFHGIVIFFGFLCVALWRLAQASLGNVRSHRRAQRNERGESNSFTLSSPSQFPPSIQAQTTGFPLNRIREHRQKKGGSALDEPSSSEILGRPRSPLDFPESPTGLFPSIPNHGRHYIADFSAFYRQPRRSDISRASHNDSPNPSGAPREPPKGPDETLCSDTNSSMESQDSFDELMEVPIRANVDYSVRESDTFYGTLANGLASPVPTSPRLAEESQQDQSTFREWAVRTMETFRRPKKKERGFQVMRPPRPDL